MNSYSNYNSYNHNPYTLSSTFKQQANSLQKTTNRYPTANPNMNTNTNSMYHGNTSTRVDDTRGYNRTMNRNNVNTGNNQRYDRYAESGSQPRENGLASYSNTVGNNGSGKCNCGRACQDCCRNCRLYDCTPICDIQCIDCCLRCCQHSDCSCLAQGCQLCVHVDCQCCCTLLYCCLSTFVHCFIAAITSICK